MSASEHDQRIMLGQISAQRAQAFRRLGDLRGAPCLPACVYLGLVHGSDFIRRAAP